VDNVTRLAAAETELVVEAALPLFRFKLTVRPEGFRDAAGLTSIPGGGRGGGGSGRLPVILLRRRLRLAGLLRVAGLRVGAFVGAVVGTSVGTMVGRLGRVGVLPITVDFGLSLPVALVQGRNEVLEVGQPCRLTDASDFVL